MCDFHTVRPVPLSVTGRVLQEATDQCQCGFVLLYFALFPFFDLVCIFSLLFCLSVSVKWLAVKTAYNDLYCVGWGVTLLQVSWNTAVLKMITGSLKSSRWLDINSGVLF